MPKLSSLTQAGAGYGWPAAEGPDGDGGTRPPFWLAPRDASPSGVAYARGALWMAGLRGQRLWRRLSVKPDTEGHDLSCQTGHPVAPRLLER